MAGTTTVVFTDIVDSTGSVYRMGDDHATAAISEHLQLLRVAAHEHHGRVAKTLGDGVMALFDSAYEGASAAVSMQQAVQLATQQNPTGAFGLRVGVHVGDVLEDDGADVFGAAVIVARRLCDAAAPGEILASNLVPMLAGNRRGIEFGELEPRQLKGVPDPTPSCTVFWQPLAPAPELQVVVADDAALVRAGVVTLLVSEGFDVVAQADDFDSLMDAVDAHHPDLVITDIRMPPTNRDEGLRAAEQIKLRYPQTAVLVLSQYVEASAAASLLDGQTAGIGYVLKERVGELDEFVATVRRIVAGESVIDPLVTDQLLDRNRNRDQLARLTDRERDVLELMAQGMTNRDISSKLYLSEKTVETHVRSIFNRLGLLEDEGGNRRVQAVVRWLNTTDR